MIEQEQDIAALHVDNISGQYIRTTQVQYIMITNVAPSAKTMHDVDHSARGIHHNNKCILVMLGEHIVVSYVVCRINKLHTGS